MSTPRAFLAAAITLAMVLFPSVGWAGCADKTEKTTTVSPKTDGGTVAAERGNAKESGSPSAVENELSLLRRELDAQRAVLDAQQARIAELEAHSQQVEAERGALQDELARIAKLEAALNITPGVAPNPTASATSAVLSASRPPATQPAASQPSVLSAILPPQAGTQAQRPEDLSKRVENIEDRMKTFGPFVLSGDFRLRDEPWFGGPADHSLDRNRERYRLRFNVDARLNSDFAAGFSLATGDVNDPITTNQTATQFYARKPFNLDRAFVVYRPHAFKELMLQGGKFAYPWYNTELTWDKDLNPEGLAQTLAFDLDSTPVLKRIAFVGFELPFAEVAGVSLTNKSIVQSVTYGGQVQTIWQLAHWLKFGAYSGFYNFHNADPIALALAKANAKNPQTPLVGLLPLGSGGNTVQNSIVTTTSAGEVTVAGTPYPTGVGTVTNAQFASKFGLFDALARFDISTPAERWPLAFIGDYVQNTKTCENVPNILPPPSNTGTAMLTQSTNFPCSPNQRRGYWGEVQFGRALQTGDWQFGYTRIFVEREAVLSNFDYSEMRQGSNVEEQRVNVLYQVHRNVQLAFLGLFGRPLNFGSSKPPEALLKRLQFDVLYTF